MSVLALLLAACAWAEPKAELPKLVPVVLPASIVEKYGKLDSTPMPSGFAFDEEPEEKEPGEKKKRRRRGLRILGIEMSGDRGAPDDHEPYEDKSLSGALDWDIRARVKFDGLGGRAKHRNPKGIRSLEVGALAYFDLPHALGVGPARDDVYKTFGAAPDKQISGVELGVSGALNPYVGGATVYDQRSHVNSDRAVSRRSLGARVGWSPLGDNPGKPWNYTLLGGASYEERAVLAPGWLSDRSGLGLMAGVAFQRAMKDVAPWLKRGKARAWVDGSAVRSPGANAALELTVAVTDSLGVTGGVTTRYTPSPEAGNPEEKPWDWGGIVGLDLSY